MTQAIRNARIEVFKPSNNSFENPNFTIPEEDIASVSSTVRISARKDTATFEIHNDNGEYSNNSNVGLQSGQRVQFWVDSEVDATQWGDGDWGDGSWGGERLHWTGMIRDISYTYGGPNKSFIELKAEDFVFGVMSQRLVFNAWESTAVAGSSNAVLNEALSNEAPEIDRGKIEDFTSTTTTITADGTNLLEFSEKLARRANAVTYSRRDRLHFEDLSSKTAKFDLQGSDIGFFELQRDDTDLVNSVRVDGGTDKAIDDEQTTQNGWDTATESSRVQFQVSTRKSEITRIDIWTDPSRTGSGENLTLRLQKNDSGSPVAPGDKTSDIVSETISSGDLTSDGYTSYTLSSHTLPEPNPWILLETDGSSGQDVGIDTADNTPTYKAWYPYTITIRRSNTSSRDKYRKREYRIKEDSIKSTTEAREVAEEKLNHDSVPEEKIAMPADSKRMYTIRVGDVINLDFPREEATGDFIVSERNDEYQGNRMHTDITAQEVGSI